MRNENRTGYYAGFTIIEVVAVLLILGILSAIALSRMPNVDQFYLPSQVEAVKNHLRYAADKSHQYRQRMGHIFQHDLLLFVSGNRFYNPCHHSWRVFFNG